MELPVIDLSPDQYVTDDTPLCSFSRDEHCKQPGTTNVDGDLVCTSHAFLLELRGIREALITQTEESNTLQNDLQYQLRDLTYAVEDLTATVHWSAWYTRIWARIRCLIQYRSRK